MRLALKLIVCYPIFFYFFFFLTYTFVFFFFFYVCVECQFNNFTNYYRVDVGPEKFVPAQ